MKKLTALLLITATALLGACNKTGGDNAGSTASGSSKPASAAK